MLWSEECTLKSDASVTHGTAVRSHRIPVVKEYRYRTAVGVHRGIPLGREFG